MPFCKLMERFLIQKEISSYDQAIIDEFQCDKKTLERYLKEIELLYAHIITILPFIQKWLPDLIIVEPLELREAYAQKLKLALGGYDVLPSH